MYSQIAIVKQKIININYILFINILFIILKFIIIKVTDYFCTQPSLPHIAACPYRSF
jgi:hypothetical protein